MKYVFSIFSLVLLSYLLLPGPTIIDDFPPLPSSIKSQEAGDTWQVSNVAGYYSDNYRDFVTKFYRDEFFKKTTIPFPPLRLNYPPEFAFVAIKEQTHSTYLEEYVYPLRGSLFINGFEPFEQAGSPKYNGAVKFKQESGDYLTKATLRFYPSPIWVRVVTWLGITLSILMLWKLSKKTIFNK